MKSIALALSVLLNPSRRRNVLVLARMLIAFLGIVILYTGIFHALMVREGQSHSWATGVYWTLVMMSTLGLGDITFESDLGRIFSVIVLLSGTVFMLVLLPFMFIQFFYVPWLEGQAIARAPRELPAKTSGHVVLTHHGLVEQSLIRLLDRSRIAYVVLVADLETALRLYDEGYRVMVGDLDDPQTYQHARVERAALVVANQSDTTNSNIAFTVREISESVMIVSTAAAAAAVDILELAGSSQVLQFGEMLGQAMARRVLGRDARSHLIGQFGALRIAEAAAAGTPLVGRSLREIRLRDHVNVTVVGVWERGKFEVPGPDTRINANSVLVLAGSELQLTEYDSLFTIYSGEDAPVIILGAGRVGRATASALQRQGIDYRVVEKMPDRLGEPEKYNLGDAAELEILEKAGIRHASSVVITTRDDDVNVYLTIYCRRLRPDIQILARANSERNVSTLHRAGSDFVLSYATTGANMLFNLLKKTNVLLLAEGLDAFRVPLPSSLVGKSLIEARIREISGCSVVAVVDGDSFEVNPKATQPLRQGIDLVVIGDIESEAKFFREFID